MANIFEFLSKDGNITPEKARKSRQMPFHDKTAYVWMGMLPLKKRVNRDKCSFATKQRMFGVFAIDEILRYRGSRIPGSPTLCHPVTSLNFDLRVTYLSFDLRFTRVVVSKGSTGTRLALSCTAWIISDNLQSYVFSCSSFESGCGP